MSARNPILIFLILLCLNVNGEFAIDKKAFLAINGCRNSFFDGASIVLSDVAVIPNLIYVYSLGYGYFRDKSDALNFGKAGLLTDIAVMTVNQTLKAVVKRERPKFAIPEAQGDYSDGFVTRIIPSEKYSFPSQSASLSMSAALVFSTVYPNWDKYFYTLAILNGWARIYRAAHYPGDVLFGEVLGFGVTYGMLAILKKADNDMDICKNKPRLPIFSISGTF